MSRFKPSDVTETSTKLSAAQSRLVERLLPTVAWQNVPAGTRRSTILSLLSGGTFSVFIPSVLAVRTDPKTCKMELRFTRFGLAVRDARKERRAALFRLKQ